MTAEAGQLSDHRHLGELCGTCGADADVVATWVRPASRGNPYGSLRHVPLCNQCALVELNSDHPPRVTEHDAAVKRTKQAIANRRAANRKVLKRDQQTLEGV